MASGDDPVQYPKDAYRSYYCTGIVHGVWGDGVGGGPEEDDGGEDQPGGGDGAQWLREHSESEVGLPEILGCDTLWDDS